MKDFLLKDEKGIVMLVVIGIMLVITVLAFGVIGVSESDLFLSARDNESMAAFHVAEAGIQKALWQLENLGNSMEPRNFNITVGNGVAEVGAVQEDANKAWYWTIDSTGTCGHAKRHLRVTVFNFSLWNMNMGLGDGNTLASGGNGILGTTSIDGPFYVRGNVELSGSSKITGGPFFIKTGTLRFMNNSSSLGEEGNLIEAFIEPAEGNEDIIDRHGNPLNPGDPQVYVSSLSNQVPDVKLPPLDPLLNYRKTAASESAEPSTAYPGIITTQTEISGYKVLDDDLDISTGPVESRRMYRLDSNVNSFGLETGEFAWDKNNRRLYVNGTVFIDGNLTIGDNSNSEINFYGNGTLVVNGEIFIKGKLRPPSAVNYRLDSEHVLGLITAETIYVDVNGSNSTPQRSEPDISGAFFASKKVKFNSNNTSFVGSMIAGVLDFAENVNNSHIFTDEDLPGMLPPSLPGRDKWLAMTASWREVD